MPRTIPDWEKLYGEQLELCENLKAKLAYLECENVGLRVKNEKLMLVVRAVEALCGEKILMNTEETHG